MSTKFKIKRIQPITVLPKIKGLQDSNLKYLLNGKKNSLQKQDNNKNSLKSQPQNDESQKVEFSHKNNYHLISHEFLLQGYSQSYDDFYELFIKHKDDQNYKDVSQETLEIFREKLIKIENFKIQRQTKEQLQLYHELAEKIQDKNSIYIAKYFYNKIIEITMQMKNELFAQKEIEMLNEWFIKGKLGFIRCLDFVKEKETAIELLEEVLQIAQQSQNYQEQINEQLISLHRQIAEQEKHKKNYKKAMKHFEKCFKSCKEVQKFEIECEIVLKIAQTNILLEQYKEPIELIKSYLKSTYKLNKEFQLDFEIQGYKILAECQLNMQNLDEAENYYRNLHELLKKTEDDSLLEIKCQATNQLGQIQWMNRKYRESGQFFSEYLDNALRMIPKDREMINHARISLSLVNGFSEYLDFVDYLHMSKNPVNDLIKFKKTGKFSQFNLQQ